LVGCEETRSWVAALPLVTWLLNDVPGAAGWSANEVVFGRQLTHLDNVFKFQKESLEAVELEDWMKKRSRDLEFFKEKLRLEDERQMASKNKSRVDGKFERAR
jgi:hypothetical protein